MIQFSIDTCCLLNLFADESFLPAFSKAFAEPIVLHVPPHVSREATYLLRPSVKDASKLEKVVVDLSIHFSSGLLCQCDLDTDDELASFVGLATGLDDGEAACLAIAASRSWVLATDDRLALRAAQSLGVDVISTPAIIKSWAAKTNATSAELRRVIEAIGRYAKFAPHHSSPDYTWWIKAGSP